MHNQFKDTKFKVEIVLRDKQQGKAKICVGLKEVSRFTDAERSISCASSLGMPYSTSSIMTFSAITNPL